MIPSVLAHQVQHGVKDFLRTTFPIATPHFHRLLENLLEKEDGLFRGPYLSINLPFRQGKGGPDFFPEISLKFPPYLHQEQAFLRFSGAHPRSTIVATGMGRARRNVSFQFLSDVHIAHSAMSIGAVLFTEDRDHFEIIASRIPPLRVEFLSPGKI
jgi:hypothetical protein